MNEKLQLVLNAAMELPPLEKLQVISVIAQSLQQPYQTVNMPSMNGTRLNHHDKLAGIRRAKPVTNIDDLIADFWPEDESADDILEYLHQQRQESRG